MRIRWGGADAVKGLSSAEIMRLLEADGWALKRIKGDHYHFKHPAKSGLVTIAHPKKDVPVGTLRNIFRQAGLKWPLQ